MDDMVSISEFRARSKFFLDAARDKSIMLRRGDEVFQVSFYGVVGVAKGYMGETFEVGGQEVTPTFGTYMQNTPLPKNHNVKILEDGTVTKAVPTDPNFSYNPPLLGAREILAKNKSEATPRVDDLFATNTPIKAAHSQAMSGELPCCANEMKPCKHWVWDSSTGEGYKNSISGRFLEVE